MKSKYKDLRAHTRGDKNDARTEEKTARRQTPPVGAASAGTPAPAAPGLAGKSTAKGQSATHPDQVLKGMNIPPQLMPGFIAAVKSGMQFVTGSTTHQYFLQQLQGPGPAAQKLSEGVYALIQIIAHQAKGAMPPQVLIPAGVYLISWVADYTNRAKLMPVSDKDIGLAVQMFIHTVVGSVQKAQQAAGPQGPQGPAGQQPPQGAAGQQPPQPGPALPKMKAPPMQAPGANPNLGPGAAPGPAMTALPSQGAA
jgi:hypothetical protein